MPHPFNKNVLKFPCLDFERNLKKKTHSMYKNYSASNKLTNYTFCFYYEVSPLILRYYVMYNRGHSHLFQPDVFLVSQYHHFIIVYVGGKVRFFKNLIIVINCVRIIKISTYIYNMISIERMFTY